jgi:hypothetical protein
MFHCHNATMGAECWLPIQVHRKMLGKGSMLYGAWVTHAMVEGECPHDIGIPSYISEDSLQSVCPGLLLCCKISICDATHVVLSGPSVQCSDVTQVACAKRVLPMCTT